MSLPKKGLEQRILPLSLLLLLSVPISFLLAQSLPQPEIITAHQGLPQAFVPSIVQDHQGFIWAATRDGLCRYDGYQFKVFQPDPNGHPSLSFAGLEQLVLDQHGRIWITSERGDLDVFDPRLETFTNVSRQPAFHRFLKGSLSFRLGIDRQDRLWLMPIGKGLICWDLTTNRGQWFHHQTAQAGSLGSDEVRDMAQGPDGAVWLATANGLDQYVEGSHRFVHRRHQPGNLQSLPDNQLAGLHWRANGELMVLSRQHLVVWQTRTGQLRTYSLPAQGNQWQDPHFAADRQGTVYFDQNNILFRFTAQNGPQVAAQWNQPTDDCASLLVDQTEVLWVGTNGAGIRTYDLRPNPFKTRRYSREFYLDLLANDSIGLPSVPLSVLAKLKGLISYQWRSTFDAVGRLWFNVGSSDVYRLDRQQHLTVPVPLPIPFRSRVVSDTPCPLATDPQGRVWAVYDQYAYWYDEPDKCWVQFPHSVPHQPGSAVTGLVVDGQALWLASRAGGLWRLDRQTGQVRQFANHPGDPTSLSSNSLYCLSADPADTNRLWIGTFGNGLCLFDKRTGRFRRFSQAEGLPNNVIYSALPDRQGYLWMGTNKGLCRLNRRTFTTKTFTRDDGILADEFNSYHYLQFPDGKILMGGLEGFTFFYPSQLVDDPFQPVVELTQLQINNQVINPDRPANGSPVARLSAPERTSPLGTFPIQAIGQLSLAYDQNYITIKFAALQFNRPAKNRYRYRLEGLEDTWKVTESPEAIYTSLLPGNYVLALNASNTSGRWSQHVRKLGITIQPPIWATWWAYLLYALTVTGVGYWLIRSYINRVGLQHSVVIQQKELALKQQEAEQLKIVDAMKTRFFTNITHEFRTPLTLILAPAQQLRPKLPLADDQRRVNSIERNANQLLRLVNQLLELARLESHTLPVAQRRGHLVAFVDALVQPFILEASAQDIDLQFTHNGLANDYWFDADKLERIVYNLLANAIKFTPAGGQVAVSLTPANFASESVRLTVTDTGIGIPAAQLPFIFDRFYQAGADGSDLSVNPRATGTGIGLALVKELVALQQGQVSVSSQPDQGTAFVVDLPYPLAGKSLAATPTGGSDCSESAEGYDPNAHPATVSTIDTDVVDHSANEIDVDTPVVLLVEDNPELADFIAESLPPVYRILRAVNGRQGFEQALALLPDLVISDVLMPVLDGYGFCQLLKEDIRTNHIPIILLTARASLESRLEGLSKGADDYLTKPFHVRELQLRVGNLLEQRRRLRNHIRTSLTVLDAPQTERVSTPTDPFIIRLYGELEAHLDESDFGVEQLANCVGMSRSYLFRKVKTLTGMSASELERNYRLQRATHYLQQGHPIAQTGYMVGFDTPAYFTQSFRKLYGITPTDYLNRRNHS